MADTVAVAAEEVALSSPARIVAAVGRIVA